MNLNIFARKKFRNSLKSNMQNHIEAESPIKQSEWVNHFHSLLKAGDDLEFLPPGKIGGV